MTEWYFELCTEQFYTQNFNQKCWRSNDSWMLQFLKISLAHYFFFWPHMFCELNWSDYLCQFLRETCSTRCGVSSSLLMNRVEFISKSLSSEGRYVALVTHEIFLSFSLFSVSWQLQEHNNLLSRSIVLFDGQAVDECRLFKYL